MYEVLEIHRSTYYKYLNFKDPDYPEYAVMKETFNHHKKTLGYLTLYRNGPRAYLSTILDLETRQWVTYKISPKTILI